MKSRKVGITVFVQHTMNHIIGQLSDGFPRAILLIVIGEFFAFLGTAWYAVANVPSAVY
jgi:hypothetical protein